MKKLSLEEACALVNKVTQWNRRNPTLALTNPFRAFDRTFVGKLNGFEVIVDDTQIEGVSLVIRKDHLVICSFSHELLFSRGRCTCSICKLPEIIGKRIEKDQTKEKTRKDQELQSAIEEARSLLK